MCFICNKDFPFNVEVNLYLSTKKLTQSKRPSSAVLSLVAIIKTYGQIPSLGTCHATEGEGIRRILQENNGIVGRYLFTQHRRRCQRKAVKKGQRVFYIVFVCGSFSAPVLPHKLPPCLLLQLRYAVAVWHSWMVPFSLSYGDDELFIQS